MTQIKGRRQAKAVLLTGFLGSGKTTLIRHVLSSSEDLSGTAVLVNEFGEVGIDGELLRQFGSDLIEVANGCICCSVRNELVRSLRVLIDRFNPSRILIEATGLAEPDAVAEALDRQDLTGGVRLHKRIAVLDARMWKARVVLGPIFWKQLSQSDLILLNKIDQVQAGEVQQILDELQQAVPGCAVVPARFCNVDQEILWAASPPSALREKDLHSRGPQDPARNPIEAHVASRPGHSHTNGGRSRHSRREGDAHSSASEEYTTFTFSDTRPLDPKCFDRFLKELPEELYRVKGFVRLLEETVHVNWVRGVGSMEQWRSRPESVLAFIGWGVDPKDILDRLERCIIRRMP